MLRYVKSEVATNKMLTTAQNYTVSITCEDQLSPTGGNFALRFARRRLPAALTPSTRGVPMDEDISEEDLFNPHDDAEPFFRDILRQGHGRLAPSLHRLVTLLRETLPIVTELEAIRRDEERVNRAVDTYPKAAGWYRLLYGDLRYVSHVWMLLRQTWIYYLLDTHWIFG